MDLSNVSIESKSEVNIPEGAKILKKSYDIRIEEIENGYIISKSYNIKYMVGDETSYEYFTKKWYSEEKPIQLNMPEGAEKKSLAESFDED